MLHTTDNQVVKFFNSRECHTTPKPGRRQAIEALAELTNIVPYDAPPSILLALETMRRVVATSY